MRVSAFAGGLGLREQEIGIEAQSRIFVGGGRKLFTGRQKGLSVRRRVIKTDQHLLSFEKECSERLRND